MLYDIAAQLNREMADEETDTDEEEPLGKQVLWRHYLAQYVLFDRYACIAYIL